MEAFFPFLFIYFSNFIVLSKRNEWLKFLHRLLYISTSLVSKIIEINNN